MKKTGQVFEMNPETFTLENVFAMELHRFQETIGDIVNCAVKELAIEKVGTAPCAPDCSKPRQYADYGRNHDFLESSCRLVKIHVCC